MKRFSNGVFFQGVRSKLGKNDHFLVFFKGTFSIPHESLFGDFGCERNWLPNLAGCIALCFTFVCPWLCLFLESAHTRPLAQVDDRKTRGPSSSNHFLPVDCYGNVSVGISAVCFRRFDALAPVLKKLPNSFCNYFWKVLIQDPLVQFKMERRGIVIEQLLLQWLLMEFFLQFATSLFVFDLLSPILTNLVTQ